MALPPDVKSTSSLEPVVFDRNGEVRTSSRDVAALFGKEHFAVLRDIRNLVAKAPEELSVKFVAFKINDLTGESTSHYEMDRDGFTLLAMGFTGQKALKFKMAYIAAFNALEQSLRQRPQIDLNNPADLRMLLANYANDKIELQAQVASMETTVAAFNQIADASGSMCGTDAGKHLGIGRKALFAFMRQNRWLYRRPGTNYDLAYQDKIEAGLLEHKVTTVHSPDGTERIHTQARITPKGLAKLAKLIPPTVRMVTGAA